MRVIVLGCATSTGVPIIGCSCSVCTSSNPKNKRTRSSVFIRTHGKNILIDTAPDLRFQALKHNITRLDAVLYTHSHADHTHGIDELRTYNFVNEMVIPIYGSPQTIENIKTNFKYIFDDSYATGGKPKLEMTPITEELDFQGIRIIPIEINHANWIIFGYRIGEMAYLTDCSGIPEESLKKLGGLDLLIIDALRYTPHQAHFSVDEAVETIRKIEPKIAVFTHMGHEIEYEELSRRLPEGIMPGYDGMEFELDEP
ncbi:MAG: MBL fold metallo-hydrolase [Deltaproteobacteria bacterium]|nr:MBL fold metallo-hydrolase [Deltaproteobacteria bacterium]